ncbi:NAD(P)-binding protein [Mollisia scopiformis]|uniref:NAD(P)-binding protein n=1 Tax=Mollisia scopiformis TaxID=149040 RepID=A0A132BBG4_MOLSC|nr:NAD(P)-binding protein [Mollisia scopiformis]KUJ09755.1 NAD(P)-binding protein [Mollisia scopiformis]
MATQTQKYNKLAGKRVVIIGGTSGIGYAVAEACIESSFSHVTVSSSSASRVQTAISNLQKSYPSTSCTISGHTCDLSTPDLETSIEALFSKTGNVDHIVFTAGDKLAIYPIEEINYERILKAGQVRFVAPLLVAKVGKKYLNAGPESSIVLTTGAGAERPYANWSIVTPYLSGLYGMTRALAIDLKPVRVNLVSPGAVDTELWKDFSAEEKEKFFKEVGEKVPTGRIGRPEDVAEAYLWLMKDSNTTGVVASTTAGNLLV